MDVGQDVEVHTRYDDSWASGYEIAAVTEQGYRVRRKSDRTLLPDTTGEADLRPVWAGAGHQWL